MTIELGGQSIGSSRAASGSLAVERGINSDRMTMLAAIGGVLAVALNDAVLGSIVVLVLFVLVYRCRPVRQATMSAMHWLTRA